MKTNWLEELRPGDKVCVIIPTLGENQIPVLDFVDKITPKKVVVNGVYYCKRFGWAPGFRKTYFATPRLSPYK